MRFEIQRADFWKRISAFLFDIILLGIVIVGAAAALSAILGYDKHMAVVEQVENEYIEKYGINTEITDEEKAKLSEEELAVYDEYNAARESDERLIIGYNILLRLMFTILSVSVLIGHVIMEFIVPIFFKNGQTLGKKAFGLAVMHTNGVRLRGQAHFVRTIIGKCLIETLVPVYFVLMILFGSLGFVGIVALVLLLGLQIFVLASTKTRSAIHDLISDTVVVDMASQMIFENADELIAYKTKIHEEMVNQKEY